MDGKELKEREGERDGKKYIGQACRGISLK